MTVDLAALAEPSLQLACLCECLQLAMTFAFRSSADGDAKQLDHTSYLQCTVSYNSACSSIPLTLMLLQHPVYLDVCTVGSRVAKY